MAEVATTVGIERRIRGIEAAEEATAGAVQ